MKLSQPSCFLLVAWQLVIGSILQLNVFTTQPGRNGKPGGKPAVRMPLVGRLLLSASDDIQVNSEVCLYKCSNSGSIAIPSAFQNGISSGLTLAWLTSFPELPDTGRISYTHPDVIQIVLTLRGSEPIRWAEVMIKSMLYYQGRFREDNDTCSATHFPQRKRRCPDTLPLRSNRIVFHVLIDAASRPDFIQAFQAWHRPYLEWKFYQAEYHEKLLRQMPNSHHSGIPSMMKLLVPVILPSTVEKVIVMDSDMLFNHNVLELWELFYRFNSTQVSVECQVTVTARHFDWCTNLIKYNNTDFHEVPDTELWVTCKLEDLEYQKGELGSKVYGTVYTKKLTTVPPKPQQDRGLNGGLSIMHLTRLRENGWHDKWQEASKKFFERNTMLKQADQVCLVIYYC
ncbi:LARGE xylosyl- and glucuronyltransferase 2 [Clonorchis sinensis]|uniref:LARGE xylosyl- and glucuronyltransferase 2 n=1 Tax=Clonorchis sinensis TaxID=79923 RepID=A0A419QBV3_CLOSI|nr:LARGE xylosyl- and glucuronyltransferase 2 [Clonorchis sinensis]